MPQRYYLNVLDLNDGKPKILDLSKFQFDRLRTLIRDDAPAKAAVIEALAKPYICADCGHETHNWESACANCQSRRIILITVAEKHFGPDWRTTCFGKESPQ